MVARCEEAGVDIYVDAVLNHMAAPHHGIGIAGSSFTAYDYPPVYAREHFHECRQPMGTGPSRAMLQRCGLFGLPDLDTGDPHVQRQLAGYLDDLAALGVEGFRIDAAKHIAASELEAVLASLEGSESESPFVFAEVIADETIRAEEYFGVGRVTEFAYGERLSELVREGELARLSSMTESSGLIRSDQAVVFVDNHDNQRGHGDAQGVLTHRTVDAYKIANVFMLAWPYGYPKVMSSFAFDDDDARPAVDDDGRLVPVHDERGRCRAPYVCEHRWPEIVAMVDFRHRCRDAAVSSWWSDDRGAIGFAREGCGYVALNAGESPVGATVETSLPPGHHCDVLRPGCARRVEVDDSGRATITIPARGAIALLP
jgi:alpha-amylase